MSSPPPKKRKRYSGVWVHFLEDAEQKIARCKYCDKEYTNTFSTNTMLKHVEANHKEQQLGKKINDTLEERIIKWIITSLVPYNCINSSHFKDLFDERIPGAQTIIARISDKFEQEKIKIKNILQKNSSKISFSHDIWTGVNTKSFLAIVATFVDENFCVRTVLVGFKEIARHSGNNIAQIFWNVVEEYEIEDKLGFITTDNAAANDVFFRELGKRWSVKNPEELDVRCLAHIINLVVKAFLNEKDDEEQELTKKRVTKETEEKLLEKKRQKRRRVRILFIFHCISHS